MKFTKALRAAIIFSLTLFLTTGVIIAFGVLSASGMLLITPSIFIAIAAFVFGGLVEGEVFKQEISEGLEDLTLLGKAGYRHLILNSLEPHITHPAESGFIFEYQTLKNYLDDARKSKLTAKQKAEKAIAEKRFKHMRKYITKQVLSKKTNPLAGTPYHDDKEFKALISTLRKQMPVVTTKMILLRIALVFSLLCGIGFGLATAAALPAALGAISGSLSFLVWPLAIIAAIGYTFLIFHTVKDILFSDKFQKWMNCVKNWFMPTFKLGLNIKTLGHILKAALVVTLTVATITICIMGTLATAGTWWIAVKHGVRLIPHMYKAAGWIRNILTPLVAVGCLVFSTFSSLKSIYKLYNKIKTFNPKEKLACWWSTLIKNENPIQIVNPFRIICCIIQNTMDTILLLGHVTATGAGRDQFMRFPTMLVTGASAGSELTQDITFLYKKGEKTTIQWLVTGLISPLLLCSAIWQNVASQFNTTKPRVSFMLAIKNAFGMQEKPDTNIVMPQQSNAWRKVEINRYFKKEEARLKSARIYKTCAKEKLNTLYEFKEHLIDPSKTYQHKSVLNKHRFFQSQKPPRSQLFYNKMTARYQTS